ncbi:tail length tape-measure protein [Vibrio phage phiKT1028]|nr:tail length tape-measure protein [Vibrio phage phiKT1028]
MSKSPNFVEMGTPKTVGVANTSGTQLIDLDETYEDKSNPEEVEALTEYLKTGKLSKKALASAKVDGMERFEPGTTTLNGLLGGESFLETMKQGVVDFVKWIINILNGIARWFKGRIKGIVDFFSDSRELAKSDAMIREIETKLVEMGGPAFNIIDAEDLFGKNPVSTRKLQVIHTLRTRNQDTLAAAAKLEEMIPVIKDFIAEISRHRGNVERAHDRVSKATGHLRKRAKDNSLTHGDLKNWQAAVTDTISQSLMTHKLQGLYVKLVKMMTDRSAGNLDGEKLFQASTKMMKELATVTKDTVSVKNFSELSSLGGRLRKKVAENPDQFQVELDTSDLSKLDDLVKLDDLGFITEVSSRFGDNNIVATYRMFAANAGSYSNTLQKCVETALMFNNEITYISEWSQRYEFILAVYSLAEAKDRNELRGKLKAEIGVEVANGIMDGVSDDTMSPHERNIYKAYGVLLPNVKRTMNELSRRLKVGVKV